MKLPSVRFTMRRMIVAVALVATISGGVIESERRRERFLDLARRFARDEYEVSAKAMILIRDFQLNRPRALSRAEIASGMGLDPTARGLFLSADRDDVRVVMRDLGLHRAGVESRIDHEKTVEEGNLGRLLERERYDRELRRRYQRAARYPWLPVTPDPPDLK